VVTCKIKCLLNICKNVLDVVLCKIKHFYNILHPWHSRRKSPKSDWFLDTPHLSKKSSQNLFITFRDICSQKMIPHMQTDKTHRRTRVFNNRRHAWSVEPANYSVQPLLPSGGVV